MFASSSRAPEGGRAAGTGPAGIVPLAAGFVLVGLFLAVVISLSWVGFLESDDLEYARAATAWVEAFPHLGDSHWGLRHMIVLPVAASFALFGRSEVALALPMIGYAAGIVALTGLAVRQVAGNLAGFLAALIVASLPLVATGASMVFSDLPEAFFVVASLWAFFFAARTRRLPGLLGAGALAGCAFITRETTLALLVLYLVLFLFATGRRIDFVWMGVGFALVMLADTAWLWLASGDPLWRMNVTLRGVAGDNPSVARFIINDGGLDRHGVIAAPRPLQALAALFANQSTGLIAWAGVPAAIALALRSARAPGHRAARLFAGAALVWFMVLSFGFYFLWIIPRYQIVTMVALSVPLAIWLAGRLHAGARLVPLLVMLALVGSGFMVSIMANRTLMFGERGLVAFARTAPGPVLTDPATLRGATWLLENEGLLDKVAVGPCSPGSLCYINPRPRRPLPADWPSPVVPPGAVVLMEVARQPTLLARLLDDTALLKLLPGVLRNKIAPPPLAALGVRVPPG